MKDYIRIQNSLTSKVIIAKSCPFQSSTKPICTKTGTPCHYSPSINIVPIRCPLKAKAITTIISITNEIPPLNTEL